MNHSPLRRKQSLLHAGHYALAFLIPFCILGICYMLMGMYPFGEKSVLIADLNSQYVDYYSALRDILLGDSPGGLLYSWSAGMGLNFIGIFTYYLCSPFSLLILLFSKAHITEAILLMLVLKIGCSGLSFYCFANKKWKLPPVLGLALSSCYALMSYCMVYTSNPMWLDAIILLPLVILGVDRIIEGKKPLLFCLCMIATFVTNYYISYMVGIFSFLYFLYAYFSSRPADGRFPRRLGVFLLAAVLSIGCAALTLLPSFYSLFDSYSASNLNTMSGLTWGINLSLTELLSRLFLGSYEDLTYGMPNVFCGLFVLLTLPLYFCNTKIARREKIGSALLLAVFVLSFLSYDLNLVWHTFRLPTWFPFRYSFLFSFTCIFLTGRCLSVREGVRGRAVAFSFVGLLAAILLLDVCGFGYLTSDELILNAVFLGVYALIWTAMTISWRDIRWKELALAMVMIVTVGELYLSASTDLADMDKQLHYQSQESYSEYYTSHAAAAESIRQMDSSPFYRVGIDKPRDSNDAMSLGIHGLSHYSTVSNQNANLFLGSLGFNPGFQERYFHYVGANAVNDSLLGVKYVMGERWDDFGYRYVSDAGGVPIYENPYALPLGYMVGDRVSELTLTNANPFAQSNRFFSLALGETTEVYHKLPGIDSNLPLDQLNSENITVNQNTGAVTFTIVNDRPQYVYFYSANSFSEYTRAECNGQVITSSGDLDFKGIMQLGFFEAGEEITIRFPALTSGSAVIATAYFYGLDEGVFARSIETLREGGLVLDAQPGRTVSGRVTAKEDGLLFTSIPSDPGWSATVDGKPAEIVSVAGGVIAVPVTEGEHTVRFSFVPHGLLPGGIITLVSAVLLVIWLRWPLRGRARQPKLKEN